MKRCLQLAKNGLGTTYPNPLVGSVVVLENRILGEGWHYKSGRPHAEVNAVASVENKELLKDATIYVNLEPCSHYGKTPPCAELIVASGIKKVVVGNLDPNPEVAGRGIEILRAAGCEVTVGVLESACSELNKRFFTFHNKKRPYIILKWAQTEDGFLAPAPEKRTEKNPVWITNRYSRQRVHKMRAEEMAILVGTRTVLADNPSLTTRDWSGKNPVRIIIDKELKLANNLNVFDQSARTFVFTEKESVSQNNITHFEIDFSASVVHQICDILYRENIQSVIIEGGKYTLDSFIKARIWDEAYIFTAPITFIQGIPAPKVTGNLVSEEIIKDNRLMIFKNSF